MERRDHESKRNWTCPCDDAALLKGRAGLVFYEVKASMS